MLANTSPDQPDTIEFHNTTARPVDLTNWFITDSADDLLRFQITTPTTVPPLGYAAVRLDRQGDPAPDDPNIVPTFVVDELNYESTTPWPTGPDGTGDALARTEPAALGALPTSRAARPPSPGTVSFFSRVPGDTDDDGNFNPIDVERVLQRGKYMSGQVASWSDGDFTGDGLFDQRDIVEALQRGGYQSGGVAALDAVFRGIGL